MPDLEMLRTVVEADPDDPMLRFALGQKLYDEVKTRDGYREAEGHLRFAHKADPKNLACAYTYAMVLTELGETEKARPILEDGLAKAAAAPDSEGHDLEPQFREALENL